MIGRMGTRRVTQLLVATLAIGCGGSATTSGNAPPVAMQGGAAGGQSDAVAGQGGAAGGQKDAVAGQGGDPVGAPAPSGACGADECTRSLEEVKAAWSPYPADVCPSTRCGALGTAASCEELPSEALTSARANCGSMLSFTLNYSKGRGRTCYYEGNDLVGAEAWGDPNTFCGGTAKRVKAGLVPTNCEADIQVCSMRLGDPFGQRTPYSDATCASFVENGCGQVCCADVNPDCTGKPDGYPGHSCTPKSSPYCSCACTSEKWSCAC